MALESWKRRAFVLGVALLTAGLLGSRSVAAGAWDSYDMEGGKRLSKEKGKKSRKDGPTTRKNQKKQNKGKKSHGKGVPR